MRTSTISSDISIDRNCCPANWVHEHKTALPANPRCPGTPDDSWYGSEGNKKRDVSR